MTLKHFPPEFFRRHDSQEDTLYYEAPRRKVYVDDDAIDALTGFLQKQLPLRGVYLDLMSGWRSHIPGQVRPSQVVGLSLNAQEMTENDQLDRFVVQDLNTDPVLPFENQQFDAVLCNFSIQYLIKPVEVFGEVNRVLRPKGLFMVTFSDRHFPRKTIAIWRAFNAKQRIALVIKYFKVSQNWLDISTWDNLAKKPLESLDSIYAVWATKSAADPNRFS